MFKEGLYEFKYETNSGVQHYIGVVNNVDLHSIMTTIHFFEGNDTQDLVKKWRLSEGDMYKYINTFDNIHEVSKRIKEIEERKDWPVQVGQIWECKWDSIDGYTKHVFIKINNVNQTKLKQSYYEVDCTYLHIVRHDNAKKGQTVTFDIHPKGEQFTLLTQEQYEQRVKELEKDEFEKGDWVRSSGNQLKRVVGYQTRVNSNERTGLISLSKIDCFNKHDVYIADVNIVYACPSQLEKVTEQEALKVLTGKDYVLLEEGQDVYDMNTVEEWRQLAEAYDSDHMNEVLNLKEASEKGEAAGNEMKGLLDMFNDDVKNNPYRRIFKANNQDRTFTINYRDGMILDIHQIVLQLKEKYLS